MGFDDASERERRDGRSERYWHVIGPQVVGANSTFIFQASFWDRKSGWDQRSGTTPPFLDAHVRSFRVAPALLDVFVFDYVKYAHREKTTEERAEYKRRQAAEHEFSSETRRVHGPKHDGTWFPYVARESACAECVAAYVAWKKLSEHASAAWNVNMTEVRIDRATTTLDAWITAGTMVMLSVSNKTDSEQVFEGEYDVEVIG